MSTFDKLEYELYAPISLYSSFPIFTIGIVKGESPDWQDEVNGIGIEVARAENNHIGYTYNVANTYLGKQKYSIPTRVEQSFKGDLNFDTDTGKLLYVSDSKGLVDGNRHIKLAIAKAQDKLILLNKSHFRCFDKNCLYMFLTASLIGNDSDEFLEEYLNLAHKYKHSFSDIFLMALDCIFWIDTKGNQIFQHVLSDLENSIHDTHVHLLRNINDWNTGTPFLSTYKSILR